MPKNPASLANPYDPTTFQERGVALPFTTPQLGGTRARRSRDGVLELIVHNPAGTQGVYVMPWTAIATLCRPTLHDKVLNTRVASLAAVTPGTVRAVARAIAAEGLAGEAAMAAAQAAVTADAGVRRAVNHHLLTSLIHQVNLDPVAASEFPALDPTDLDGRARRTIEWLAPRLGQATNWGVGALYSLAETMAGVGVSSTAETSRIPRVMDMLRTAHDDIAEWAKTESEGDRAPRASLVCAMGALTLSLATVTLTAVRNLTGDMIGLLRNWAEDPEAIRRVIARPEWLLDGWEQICLIWNLASDAAARRAALNEIAQYIPMLPREVGSWSSQLAGREELFSGRRPIGLNEDWRTGVAVFDLVARNEQLRAVAS